MSDLRPLPLEKLDLAEFLACGLIIKNPISGDIILATATESNFKDHFFLLPLFNSNKISFGIKHYCITSLSELKDLLVNEKGTYISLKEEADTDYIEDTKTVINNLNSNGPLKKLVTCSYARYSKDKGHPLINFLNADHLQGHIYGQWKDGKGFVGITPEPLFVKSDKSYSTWAIAGSTIEEDNLLESLKDREEHNLVIEDISTKLFKAGVKVDIQETELINFGNIKHLKTKTDFTTDLKPEDIAKLLSPTSALGGYPSNDGLKSLRELKYYQYEKENRLFGGAFGISLGDIQFALVCIRNVYFSEDMIDIHSGTGIVKDSVAEKELEEIKFKRQAIRDLF